MSADAAAAEQFGPYLVYERLGVGGMATVHRARERGIEGFERIVALKRLLPHLAEDASFIKAFVREAKLASRLNHVNIVQIYELGRVGTEYFISMEHIDGRDLRRLLRHARRVTGPPPIHITVGLLLQLCDALDYAHTKVDEDGHPLGLIHRDVSPSNLLLTQAGHLKVIDFGIARAQSSQLRTQTGRVKGKLAYMAPEAIAGKDLDARSDLFAVGVIAHELLTARPLFANKNEYQTLLKVQRGDVLPPSTFNQACPPELDALVLRALAHEPEERFPSAAALRDALHELRRHFDLQTGYRDIAQWMEWAFSVEPPSGGAARPSALDLTSSSASHSPPRRASTPSPLRRHDEEEAAIELAWGGGEADHDPQPVVLDDVPDVADKLLAGTAAADPAVPPEIFDDIPPPQPSHGPALPRTRSRSSAPPPVGLRADGEPARRETLPYLLPIGPAAPPSAQAPAAERPRTPSRPPPAERPRTPSRPPPVEPARSLDELATPSPTDSLRSLPSLRSSARMRATPVPARDLPSLDPDADGSTDLETTPYVPVEPAGDPELVLAAPRPRRTSAVQPLTAPAALPLAATAVALPATASAPAPGSAATPGSAAAVERRSGGKAWLLVGVLLVAGLAAGGVAFYVTRGAHEPAPPEVLAPPPAPPPARTTGTVKFVTEPADAEISVEGQPVHRGSPWALELAAGTHSISIHRDGYKAWLTSLELAEREIQTLRVVLEPLVGAAATADATLILSTTPAGLEVILDGAPLVQRTPLRAALRPGPHTISVRQDGVEVWRHRIDAQASANYEFSPSLTAGKPRERAERAPGAAAPDPSGDRTPGPGESRAPGEPRAGAAAGAAPAPIPAAPVPIPPPPSPDRSATAIPPAAPQEPVLVAPTAVTRLSGDPPTVNKSRRSEVPPVVSAKVCIDAAGHVSSVEVLTKLERMTRLDLERSLEGWTYAPYKQGATAVPACFVVGLRVK